MDTSKAQSALEQTQRECAEFIAEKVKRFYESHPEQARKALAMLTHAKEIYPDCFECDLVDLFIRLDKRHYDHADALFDNICEGFTRPATRTHSCQRRFGSHGASPA